MTDTGRMKKGLSTRFVDDSGVARLLLTENELGARLADYEEGVNSVPCSTYSLPFQKNHYSERSAVGRVLDCDSGCRGFEPHRSPQSIFLHNQ